MTMLPRPYLGNPSLKYEVDSIASADDKVLCQIVERLRPAGAAPMTLTYWCIFLTLRMGTQCLLVISLWVYPLY